MAARLVPDAQPFAARQRFGCVAASRALAVGARDANDDVGAALDTRRWPAGSAGFGLTVTITIRPAATASTGAIQARVRSASAAACRALRVGPLDPGREAIERDVRLEPALLVVERADARAAIGARRRVLLDGGRLRRPALPRAPPPQRQLADVSVCADS